MKAGKVAFFVLLFGGFLLLATIDIVFNQREFTIDAPNPSCDVHMVYSSYNETHILENISSECMLDSLNYIPISEIEKNNGQIRVEVMSPQINGTITKKPREDWSFQDLSRIEPTVNE